MDWNEKFSQETYFSKVLDFDNAMTKKLKIFENYQLIMNCLHKVCFQEHWIIVISKKTLKNPLKGLIKRILPEKLFSKEFGLIRQSEDIGNISEIVV